MRGIAAIAFILGLAPCAAAPQAAEAPIVTEPDWLEKPSPDLFAYHYPKMADMLQIEGFAKVSCLVSAVGSLKECRVIAETPRGFGFGAAGLAMSRSFRMRPMLVDGKPTDGGDVQIPLRFTLFEPEPEPAPGAVSQEALVLALRVVDARGLVTDFREQMAEQILEIEANASPSIAEEDRQAAAAALRQALADQMERIRTAFGVTFSDTLTTSELRALAEFLELPSGEVVRDRNATAALRALVARVEATVTTTARRDLCARRICAATEAERLALAAPLAQGVVEPGSWLARPSTERIRTAIPSAAALSGAGGSARLTCKVKADGYLEDCAVAGEAPAGWGYGPAALRLSRAYRLLPSERIGPGTNVALRIDFPAAPPDPPEAAPTTREGKSLALAEKLVDALDLIPPEKEQSSAFAMAGSETPPAGVDTGVHRDVAAAWDAGRKQARERVRADFAAMMADQYTEQQLAGAVAFLTSATGRALKAKQPALDAATLLAIERAAIAVGAQAQEQYCATRICE